jgi:hypothetical protein
MSLGVVQSSLKASLSPLETVFAVLDGAEVLAVTINVDAMLSLTMALEVSLLCAVVLAQVTFETWIVYLGMASRSTISTALQSSAVLY